MGRNLKTARNALNAMTKRKQKIGYRNPPIESRFKPGQSGNPRGRRRGSRNRASPLCASIDTLLKIIRSDPRKVGCGNQLTACRVLLAIGHGDLPGDEPVVPAMIRKLGARMRHIGGAKRSLRRVRQSE